MIVDDSKEHWVLHKNNRSSFSFHSTESQRCAMSKEEDALISLFKSIGLTQAKAAEATKSPKAATTLKDLIAKYSLTTRGLDEKQAGLIAALAGQLIKSSNVDGEKEEYVLNKILDGSLKSVDQVLGRSRWIRISW